MNSTEDYLDRLLRQATGVPEPEPEPEPEVEPEVLVNAEPEVIDLSLVDNADLLSDLPGFDGDTDIQNDEKTIIPESMDILDFTDEQAESLKIPSEIPVFAEDAMPLEEPVALEEIITNDDPFKEAEIEEPIFAEDAIPLENLMTLDESMPALDNVVSANDGASLPAQEEIPLIDDTVSQVQEEIPLIDDTVSQVQEEIPLMDETAPVLEEVIPLVDETMPVIEDNMSELEGILPSLDGTSSANDDALDFDSDSLDNLSFDDIPLENLSGEVGLSEASTDEQTEPLVDDSLGIPAEEPMDALLEESVDDISVEDNSMEDIPLEDIPLEDIPSEEISPEDTPQEDISSEEILMDDAMLEGLPEGELPEGELPIDELPIEELPIEELPIEELPTEDFQIEDISNNDNVEESIPELSDISLEEGLPELSEENTEGSLGSDLEEPADEKSEESYEDDDIAALLMDIENMGKEEAMESSVPDFSDDSLGDLLAGSDDSDISEIGDILSKDENNELLDDFSTADSNDDFMNGMMSEDDLFDDMEDILDDESGKKKSKKSKKKKNKKQKDKDDGEKKPGIFKRILDALLVSEDDDELLESNKFEETAIDIAVEGAAENEAILAELSDEPSDGKKKKKKDKKSKKDKGTDKEKEQAKAEKKRLKEEKKRLKAEQKAAEAALPKKKLPKKKVIPICILCFSLGVAITLLAFVIPSSMDRKKATEQYNQHRYEETYSLLKGHKLNKSEQLMYDRTVTLLQEERKLNSYHNYMVLDMKPEALNALVQGVKKYGELSEKAGELDVMPELNSIYSQIVNELQSTFGLSVDKVSQWLNIEDSEEYSYIINSYANGTGSVIENMDVEDNSNGVEFVIENSIISAEEAEIDDSYN